MDYLDEIMGLIGDDYTQRASTLSANQVFMDTGSYALNAILSGSMYGGISAGHITTLAGESQTGKTFFALGVVRSFLRENPDGTVIWFDSEAAVDRASFEKRGIDPSRVGYVRGDKKGAFTIETFRSKAYQIIDNYIEKKKKATKKNPAPKLMMVLDSLGMATTNKESGDIGEEKDSRDMTKAQLVKGAFRVLTGKLGFAGVPLIVTNHVYTNIGSYGPSKKQGGGTGNMYASSQVVELSGSLSKENNSVVGLNLNAKISKSRFTKVGKKVELKVYYDSRGLDRYWGLLDLAEEVGLVSRVGSYHQIESYVEGSGDDKVVVESVKAYAKTIYKEPEKYFTKGFMEVLEKRLLFNFKLGHSVDQALEGETEEGVV